MKIAYEQARIKDCKQIALLRKEVMYNYYPNIANIKDKNKLKLAIRNSNDKHQEYKNSIIRGTGNWLLLAKDGERIVGFIHAMKFNKKYGKIKALFIDDKYQRKGIGSELLEKTLKWLRKRTYISLHVAKINKNAINLYKKFGFQIKTTKVPAYKFGDITLGKYKMVLRKYE